MRIVEVPHYSKPTAPELDELLTRPLFAHLATASEDGARESPVWFLWENGALWIIGNAADTFWKRIKADPRCSIGIVDFDVSTAKVLHAGFRGTATVEAWEPERARSLLSRYLGTDESAWDPRFAATVHDLTNCWIRFVPESVVMRDQSYTTIF